MRGNGHAVPFPRSSPLTASGDAWASPYFILIKTASFSVYANILCQLEQRTRVALRHDAAADAETSSNAHQRRISCTEKSKNSAAISASASSAAEDGRAYRFEHTEILNRHQDLEGLEVHFKLGGLKAREIVVLAGSPWTAFGGVSL